MEMNNNFVQYLGTSTTLLTSVPGKVAVEVKEAAAIPTKKIGHMIVVDTKQSLTEMAVIFPTHKNSRFALNEGDKVYIYSQSLTQPWATEKFELDGKTFVLLPEEQIVMVRATTFVPCVTPQYPWGPTYGSSDSGK
jgi:hypothetical protein